MEEEKGTKTVEDYIDTAKNKSPELPWQSATIAKLATSLAKAQSEMSMVEAGSTNPFFNSKYASLASVLKTAMPALNKHGLSIIQGTRFCTYSNGFYVTTTLMHESGEWTRSEIRMPVGGKKDAHAIGAATTYGRRYLLSAICGVAQEDDDGNSNIQTAPRRQSDIKTSKRG